MKAIAHQVAGAASKSLFSLTLRLLMVGSGQAAFGSAPKKADARSYGASVCHVSPSPVQRYSVTRIADEPSAVCLSNMVSLFAAHRWALRDFVSERTQPLRVEARIP